MSLLNGNETVNLNPGSALANAFATAQKSTGSTSPSTSDIVKSYAPTVMTDANVRESTIPNNNARANTYLNQNPTSPQNQNVENGSNTSGRSSTDEYGGVSFSDNYDAALGKLNGQSVDPVTQNELDLIQGQRATQDSVTRSSIDAIQAAYQSRYADTVQEQKASTAGIDQALNLGGSSRYAPVSSSGILSAKEKFDLQTLNELTTSENTQIAQLRQAQADKDYEGVSKMLEVLDKSRQEKQSLAQKIADTMTQTNTQKRKDVQSISLEAAKNGAPRDVVEAIGKSTDQNSAVAAAGDYLQSASGILGDYLQYKRDTVAQGLVPHDYQTFKDQQDAKDAKLKAYEAYNNSYGSAKGKAAGEASSGTTDPAIINSHVTNILNGNETMQQVPAGLRNQVSINLVNNGKNSFSPLASSRFTTAANRIVSNFEKLPQYQLTANGLPYIQRIDAAMKTPGSVSDQDLLDSIAKLNTAGNAISDAQVKIITDGKSFSDMLSTYLNKFKNGGVLSDSQRQEIKTIANAIYDNYKKGYQPVYDQVTKQLTDAGIPKPFWTIPDLNALSAQAESGNAKDDLDKYIRDNPDDGAAIANLIEKKGMKNEDVRNYIRDHGGKLR